MKKLLVKVARKALPTGTVHKLEESYRKSRTRLVRTRYGNPGKKQKIIAVTGTNGKTTTLNFVNEILKEAGYKTAMFTTAIIELNGERQINDTNMTTASSVNLQKFLRKAKKSKAEYTLLEVSSHALDQHKLDGVPIHVAIMTNLTQDHLDYHKTMEAYAEAKGKLFANNPKYIVLNRDDEWFGYFDKFQAGSEKITYGKSDDAEARIEYEKFYKKGSDVRVVIDTTVKMEIGTHLPGEFNVYNLTAAASAAFLLGVDKDKIVDGIANLKSIPGRFQYVPTGRDYEVVVDFAHTPDGLEKMLQAVRAVTSNRVIVVLGADGDRDKEKRPIMGEIAARYADRIFLTDQETHTEDPAIIRAAVMEGVRGAMGEAKTTEVPDRRDAIERALSSAKRGDIVLIPGLGHDVVRNVGGELVPWNDTEEVLKILNK